LELDGVMKSWAVPKGPSYDPAVRRLAMQVEDHPIDYNTFEGTIPQGEYGGGTVMLWDRGTYEPEAGGGEDAVRDGYQNGDLKIIMHGKRMLGGWVLVRMKREAGRAQWLFIKHRDEFASTTVDVTAMAMTSVVTGRTMEQIATGRSRVWSSNRTPDDRAPAETARKKAKRAKASKAAKSAKAAKPAKAAKSAKSAKKKTASRKTAAARKSAKTTVRRAAKKTVTAAHDRAKKTKRATR
jgi:bifunctional non-homologous end joining protein LigD